MARAATLEDVAAHAGVSRQTVSNALNAPQKLRPETLKRVQEVIQRLGYRPDRNARGLRMRSSGLLGYCVVPQRPGSIDVFMNEFLHALCGAAERSGRHVLLFTAPPGAGGLSVYEGLLARSAVDAFVLSDTQVGDPRHMWLAEREVPFASFGRTWVAEQPGPWVDVDGAHGAARTVRHLVDRGHTRIAFLGLEAGDPVGDNRVQGWRDACRENGLRIPEGFLAHADAHRQGSPVAARLLDLPEPPTAIIAATDGLALGAYAALNARGLRIGADVAVAGFDDTPSASVVVPGLTSVRQPVERIAERVVRALDEGMTSGELLSPELVVRGSSEPEVGNA